MSLSGLMTGYVTLQRKTDAKDASGGLQRTYAAVAGYSDVAVDIQPASGSVQMRYMANESIVTHSAFFADNVPAVAGDRLVGSDGRIYEVKGRRVPGARDQWPTVVDVEEHL